MNINDEDAIGLARTMLEEKFTDLAEPLWDLDDDGNPIYVDVGCARWVICELFNIQDDPAPAVDRDEHGIAVVIQAELKWDHWNYKVTREFYVPIYLEDGRWMADLNFGWEDVDITDVPNNPA